MKAADFRRSPARLLAAATAAAMLGPGAAWADDTIRLGVIEENDSVGFDTDKYYTQGIALTYLGGDVDRESEWAGPFQALSDLGLFAPPRPDTPRRYEILLGQSMFTPEDTAREDPDPDDRPYAGWFYGGVGLIQDTDRRRLDHLELLAGIVGPSAEGKKVQNDYHQFIGVDESRGWDRQLHDEPGLMLSYERKWRLLQEVGDGLAVDAIPEVGATVGNVMTYAEVGGLLRFGKNLEADYGQARIRPALSGTSYFNSDYLDPDSPFGFYVFVGAQARAVARNMFLDGNTFEDSSEVDSEPLVADLMGGASLFWGETVKVDGVAIYRTEEFEGQSDPTRFAGINVTIGF